MITPKDYIRKYTDNREIHIHAAQDLKCNLRQRYEIFYKPIKRPRAASCKSQKKNYCQEEEEEEEEETL